MFSIVMVIFLSRLSSWVHHWDQLSIAAIPVFSVFHAGVVNDSIVVLRCECCNGDVELPHEVGMSGPGDRLRVGGDESI